jgi:hypothetical protein
MRSLYIGLLFLLALTACTSQQDIHPYPATGQPQQVIADMSATRERAAANDKLAMYVLGANWCHDSTDFATLIEKGEAAPLIAQRYEVQFINVGYLEYIRDYVSLYDVPVIYGTPTVMVVQPSTNKLLNRSTLPYWRSASNLTSADALRYFEQFDANTAPAAVVPPSAALQRALAQIDQFEVAQAQRIYAGYQVLGPMLQAMEEGRPAAGFEKKWGNLGKMRSALPADLKRLRASAREQDQQGITDIKLQFPHYALFTD